MIPCACAAAVYYTPPRDRNLPIQLLPPRYALSHDATRTYSLLAVTFYRLYRYSFFFPRVYVCEIACDYISVLFSVCFCFTFDFGHCQILIQVYLF